jgi:hypothetical protein
LNGFRSGVLLLPGPRERGDLEELVLRAAREAGRVVVVDQFLRAIEQAHLVGPRIRSKGRLQSYLSSCRDVPRTLFQGLSQGLFDLEDSSLSFVHRFFENFASPLPEESAPSIVVDVDSLTRDGESRSATEGEL